MERTNALHATLPEPADVVTIDVAWTRQALILPAARRLVAPAGWIVSLVKPQYEAKSAERHKGVVRAESLAEVVLRVCADLTAAGLGPVAMARSPIPGGAGNIEFFALLPGGGPWTAVSEDCV